MSPRRPLRTAHARRPRTGRSASARTARSRSGARFAQATLLVAVSLASATAAAHFDPPCQPGFVLDERDRCVRRPVHYMLTDAPAPAITYVRPVPTVRPPEPPRPSVTTAARSGASGGGTMLIAGAGAGGLVVGAGGATTVSPSYLLHLGLALGAAEFALRCNLTPSALDLGGTGTSLYATRATFNYRFIRGGAIHPVAGVGLESIVADPGGGPLGHAFATTARAGLEAAYTLSQGALALGIDVTGHLPFAHNAAFPTHLSWMLGFGAYLDLRF